MKVEKIPKAKSLRKYSQQCVSSMLCLRPRPCPQCVSSKGIAIVRPLRGSILLSTHSQSTRACHSNQSVNPSTTHMQNEHPFDRVLELWRLADVGRVMGRVTRKRKLGRLVHSSGSSLVVALAACYPYRPHNCCCSLSLSAHSRAWVCTHPKDAARNIEKKGSPELSVSMSRSGHDEGEHGGRADDRGEKHEQLPGWE